MSHMNSKSPLSEQATGRAADEMRIFSIPGIPLIEPDDNLAAILVDAARMTGTPLLNGDVVVLAQKVVSKSEGRYAYLDETKPTAAALDLAGKCDKDPRLVQLILDESRTILAARPGLLIAEHVSGVIAANAGIDHSNIEDNDGRERLLMLPRDPDGSAARLRQEIGAASGVDVAVIISDSIGRPWRLGTVGQAIGVAGIPAIRDLRGHRDLFGNELLVSQQAVADELAAAASLIQGQSSEGRPVAIIRNIRFDDPPGDAADLQRPANEDIFR